MLNKEKMKKIAYDIHYLVLNWFRRWPHFAMCRKLPLKLFDNQRDWSRVSVTKPFRDKDTAKTSSTSASNPVWLPAGHGNLLRSSCLRDNRLTCCSGLIEHIT